MTTMSHPTVANNPELREQIGRRLSHAMGKAGYTNLSLANRIPCSSAEVSHWRTGRRHMAVSTLVHIASILNVSPGWLLTGDDSEVQSATVEVARRLLEGTDYAVVHRYEVEQ